MVHEIILFIHDRACAADEQQCIAIVQLPYLVRGQQLAPGHLEIGRVGAGFALRLPVRFRINRGFAKHFGDIFVRTGLVTAKIQNGITVAWNCLCLLYTLRAHETGRNLVCRLLLEKKKKIIKKKKK